MNALEPQLVYLARTCDRERHCKRGDCTNVAVLEPCKGGPHAAGLHCVKCDTHRGWAPVAALEAINKIRGMYAPLRMPRPIIRDRAINIGDQEMTTTKKEFDNSNSGALFKNSDKETDQHPDYRGSLNDAGLNYWVSAWIKTSEKGTKYMSLALKLKDGDVATDKRAAADELAQDSIPL